jgi:hypothetical protein
MASPNGLEIDIRTPVSGSDAITKISINGKELDISNARRFTLIVELDCVVTYTMDFNAPKPLEVSR